MMPRVRVKICGMTRLADALCAAEAGVDALGFIFHPKSPRHIAPESARDIIAQLPPFVSAVGVFVNADINQAAAIIQECGFDYAQLHGEESPGYCQQLGSMVPACKLIKALRVGAGSPPQEWHASPAPSDYRPHIHAFLLDTYSPKAHGGTGAAFDWQLIEKLELSKPFILAGGLYPGNAQAALAVQPYALDANSGLEDAPGIKNHSLIRQFLAQVRAAERALAGQ